VRLQLGIEDKLAANTAALVKRMCGGSWSRSKTSSSTGPAARRVAGSRLDARWTREREKRWKTSTTANHPKSATEQVRRALRQALKNDENTLQVDS
jgi:hypothetical protein